MTVLPDLLAVAAVAAGLPWGCGIPLSFLLLSRRLRPVFLLVAPFLGFAAIAALGQASVALRGATRGPPGGGQQPALLAGLRQPLSHSLAIAMLPLVLCSPSRASAARMEQGRSPMGTALSLATGGSVT